jgi:hypothetical protein
LADKANGNRTTVFFDHCTPLLDPCHDGCVRSNMTLCKHKLGFSADILCADDRMSFLGYSDQQVILYFLFLVKKRYSPEQLKGRSFLIVTNDAGFLKDARLEHNKPRSKNWKKPRLEFGEDERSVTAEGIRISVVFSNCDSCIRRKQRALRCVIDQLNSSFKQLQRKESKQRT